MSDKLEEILGEPLDKALKSITGKYRTNDKISQNMQTALTMRRVRFFTSQLHEYRRKGDALIDDLTTLILNMFLKEHSVEIRHDLGLQATCYCESHKYPVPVGI